MFLPVVEGTPKSEHNGTCHAPVLRAHSGGEDAPDQGFGRRTGSGTTRSGQDWQRPGGGRRLGAVTALAATLSRRTARATHKGAEVDTSDVLIVGGGIAGAALAHALASAGRNVTVLESSREYEDRVRGESMLPWGVKEARNLGVEQTLLDAGAHVTPTWLQYVEGVDEPAMLPMSMMIDGVAGSLNLRHPDACQALIDAAQDAGATVVRGVHDVRLRAGHRVSVTYTSDGPGEIEAALVVGADGRSSTVRRQAGISLQRDDPVNYIAGLLVDGLAGIPDDHDVMVGDGDLQLLLFNQGGGRARLYVCLGRSGQRRFAGPDGTARFLAAWTPGCYPLAAQVAAGVPAGPCATYPGDDTWTDTPFADGVVLVGDAAGHNDPIVGQGLSIAMRDARIVRDLILDGAREAADFTEYGRERSERMRTLRLIADVVSVAFAEDADNRRERRLFLAQKMGAMDPDIFPLVVGFMTGPETVPSQLVNPQILDRIRRAT
jgi:2-polyprenyl-6-methoxyphenol hydroxylase-like FAD-dependent oxidoreductase